MQRLDHLGAERRPEPAQRPLESNEAFTIGVNIFNTTKVAGAFATAYVRNTTLTVLACATAFPCANELAALTLDSCLTLPGVASCLVDPMNSNHVNITYTGRCGFGTRGAVCVTNADCGVGGVCNAKELAALSSTPLVTLNVHAVPGQHIVNPIDGKFFVTGTTGSGNIFTANCAGSGQGSAPLYYPGVCGDESVDPELGETCDPPGSDPPPPGGSLCRDDCTYCGDGAQQGGRAVRRRQRRRR